MNEQKQDKIKELIGDKPKGIHWWDENATLTLIVTWVLIWVGSIILGFFLPDSILSVVVLILALFHLYVVWWYLGQKNRSRWLMLLAFVPFGGWILVFLKDKTWD